MDAMDGRRLRAAMIAAAVAAAVFGSCSAAQAIEASSAGAPMAQAAWERIEGGETMEEALAAAGFCTDADAVPAWYAQEIGFAEECPFLAASDDWGVVALESACSAKDAVAALGNHLARRGWTATCSNEGLSEIYQKGSGSCTWLMAGFTEIDGVTDIVLRIRRD